MTYKFIQKAHLKKGALHHQLGVPKHEKIPRELLLAVKGAHAGQRIKNPSHTGHPYVHVTRLLEQRSILALTLRKLRHKRRH